MRPGPRTPRKRPEKEDYPPVVLLNHPNRDQKQEYNNDNNCVCHNRTSIPPFKS